MFIVAPVYEDVFQGFVPSKLSGEALYIAIGIIGATVMPHNLYLHSSLVQTRKFDRTPAGMKKAIRFNFLDTTIALNLAFFVNAAILILAAAAFHVNGYFHIAEIQDASMLLEELFGKTAPMFFAIALIAAGQSSTVTGTLAGQIVMEGHLNIRIRPWLRRLITRSILAGEMLAAHGDRGRAKAVLGEYTRGDRARIAHDEQNVVAVPLLDPAGRRPEHNTRHGQQRIRRRGRVTNRHDGPFSGNVHAKRAFLRGRYARPPPGRPRRPPDSHRMQKAQRGPHVMHRRHGRLLHTPKTFHGNACTSCRFRTGTGRCVRPFRRRA